MVLSAMTGSPLLAAAIVLCFYFLVDRLTLGLLPDPVRLVRRWQRVSKLRRRIASASFDRKARTELADLYLDLGRTGAAYDVLLPNYQAGDEDVYTLFALGVAAYGSGRGDEAERLLALAWERDAKFRLGAIALELGRGRLATGKPEAATAALLHLVEVRPSSVEGKVLLAKARAALGQKQESSDLYEQAWRDHAAAPRFAQRQQRWWAWRAKPARPVIYLFAMVMGVLAVRSVVPWKTLLQPRQTVDISDDE